MPTDYAVARDKRYLEPAEPLHIVGREWCFEWYQSDIDKVVKLWNGGYGLEVIARRVNSTCRDTYIVQVNYRREGLRCHVSPG